MEELIVEGIIVDGSGGLRLASGGGRGGLPPRP